MKLSLPRVNFRECIICPVVCLIGALLLPLAGIVLLALRPLMFGIALAVLIGGGGLCLISTRFRHWAAEQARSH